MRFGPVPDTLGHASRRGVCFEACPGEFLITKTDTARFHVREGREVVIDAAPDAAPAELCRLCLAAPLAALLLQRGRLALQASAVATPAGAILVLADSCIGKSTLAMEFVRRGFPFVADEIAAVEVDASGRASIFPGYPVLKLWPDVLPLFGLDAERFSRVRPELEKRAVPCAGAADSPSRPLRGIFVLQRAEAPPGTDLSAALSGAERALVLMEHLYFPGFMAGLGVQTETLRQISALARSVPVIRVLQPGGRCAPAEVADAIEKALGR